MPEELNILGTPGLKLKDMLQWMQMLPVDFLEYELVVAENGKVFNSPSITTPYHIYNKEYKIRGFDVDPKERQILFLHVIDDGMSLKETKIITND
jgi:hypothetical protein